MYQVAYINWSDVVKNKITITKIEKKEIVNEANNVINKLNRNEYITKWRQSNKKSINEKLAIVRQTKEHKEWTENYHNEKVNGNETRLDAMRKTKLRKVECPNCLEVYSANYMKRHLAICHKGKNISYQDWKTELRASGKCLFKLPTNTKRFDRAYIPIEQYNKEKMKVIII